MASIKKMSYCSLIIGSMISNQVSASSEGSDYQITVGQLLDLLNQHNIQIGEIKENIKEHAGNVDHTLANQQSTGEQFVSDLIETVGQLNHYVPQLRSELDKIYPVGYHSIPSDAMQPNLNETVHIYAANNQGSEFAEMVSSIDCMMVTGDEIGVDHIQQLYEIFPAEAEEEMDVFDENNDGNVDQMDHEISAQWFNAHAPHQRALKLESFGQTVYDFVGNNPESDVVQKESIIANLMAAGQPINATHIDDLYNAFPAEAVDEKDAFNMNCDGNVDETDYAIITEWINEHTAQYTQMRMYHLFQFVHNIAENNPETEYGQFALAIDEMMANIQDGINFDEVNSAFENFFTAFPAEMDDTFDFNGDGLSDQNDSENIAQWIMNNQQYIIDQAAATTAIETVWTFAENHPDSAVAYYVSNINNMMAWGDGFNFEDTKQALGDMYMEYSEEFPMLDLNGDGDFDDYEKESIAQAWFLMSHAAWFEEGSEPEPTEEAASDRHGYTAQELLDDLNNGFDTEEELSAWIRHSGAQGIIGDDQINVIWTTANTDGQDGLSADEINAYLQGHPMINAFLTSSLSGSETETNAALLALSAASGSETGVDAASITEALRASLEEQVDPESEPEATTEEQAETTTAEEQVDPEPEPATTAEEAESLTAGGAGDEELTEEEAAAIEAASEPAEEEPTEEQVDPEPTVEEAEPEPEKETTEEQAEAEAEAEAEATVGGDEAAEAVEFDGVRVTSDAVVEATGDEALEDDNAELRASRETLVVGAKGATADDELELASLNAEAAEVEARRAEAARVLVEGARGDDDSTPEEAEEAEEAEEGEEA